MMSDPYDAALGAPADGADPAKADANPNYGEAREALVQRAGQDQPGVNGRGVAINSATDAELEALGLSETDRHAITAGRPFASWTGLQQAGIAEGVIAALQAAGARIA